MSAETAITDPHASDSHGSTDGHGHDQVHDVSDWTYIKIAIALMVLTAAEVAVSYMDIGAFMVPALLVMMAVKFMTVILYFMHLKYDNPLFRRLFYTGLLLALFVYIVALLTFHFFE
jgi:cytochrome c oxidase subunit 4